jgi:NAD(P)-dependent dehydrogenase (short-subunit alcohol dehydrogenase family)/acyl dehydratase/putative sterol carrier protein
MSLGFPQILSPNTNMSTVEYKDRVAIVTGAGGGLGRAYAIELARRGAKVVVNDLGGSTRGEGADTKAADKVVTEIKNAGGIAVPNYDSVVDGAKIVETAIKAFGRVDIVINNAGILRDVSFHKMADKDWDLLYQVHLRGTYAVTKAAWPHMRKQKYGRVVFVTSAAGLYGNFGQAHYSTVKMGIVGFCNTLAKEGARANIRCNTIAPLAGSRMTATVMPPDMVEALKPEYVAPLVCYLSHESCEETGGVFEVGAGWVSKVRWERSKGAFFKPDSTFTPELVREQFSVINNFDEPSYPTDAKDAFSPIMENLSGNAPTASSKPKRKVGNDKVDVAKALAHKIPAMTFKYTEAEAILYALGVGAAADPLDARELKFTYENSPEFQVLPTFGVIIPSGALASVVDLPGLDFNPMMLLHGEQYMELKEPLPSSGTVVSKPVIKAVYDKGKGALVILRVSTENEAGKEILVNEYSLFIRGLGGFGGDKGPKPENNAAPARAPDVIHREPTAENQALLYRLSGDTNPLHADPAMAEMGGFHRPILHGLCTFGYATRAVLKHFCDNDVSKFKSVRVRFVKPVFPGETVVTEMWRVAPNKIVFRAKVAERGEYVLNNCAIMLHGDAGPAPAAAPAAAAAPATPAGSFQAQLVFTEMAKRINSDMVAKVGCIYRFDITSDDGSKTKSWIVDLKSGNGSVREAKEKADCTFKLKDADFVKLMLGKLNPQMAFMKGKLKISGNMMLAQKLSVLNAKRAKM